jgi:hypothetical protein
MITVLTPGSALARDEARCGQHKRDSGWDRRQFCCHHNILRFGCWLIVNAEAPRTGSSVSHRRLSPSKAKTRTPARAALLSSVPTRVPVPVPVRGRGHQPRQLRRGVRPARRICRIFLVIRQAGLIRPAGGTGYSARPHRWPRRSRRRGLRVDHVCGDLGGSRRRRRHRSGRLSRVNTGLVIGVPYR